MACSHCGQDWVPTYRPGSYCASCFSVDTQKHLEEKALRDLNTARAVLKILKDKGLERIQE